MSEYLFFYTKNNINGYLSNFYIAPFIIDNKNYDSVERYMHYQKALLFNDLITAEKIYKCSTPYQCKQLGRQVKNFKENIWNLNKEKIVYDGVYNKFKQNIYLKNKLLSTKSKILVEASPYDRIWGIGYNETIALENIEKWGSNLLGKILNNVRKELSSS